MDSKSSRKNAAAQLRIKKEPTSSSDEMKEFAETAMNELLGWYGYDEDDDDSDVRNRSRATEDSSGPECSDSGGGGNGDPWCGWCNRPMSSGAQTTGAFCSELCFSQSRRASFKRNRTCDWCRHVRHTVAHVDVKDGARHLQFCSDKCLNQYKMHIFCRETRAHLEMHPHSATVTSADCSSDASLITPDLWFKDCKESSPPPVVPDTSRESTKRSASEVRAPPAHASPRLCSVRKSGTSKKPGPTANTEVPQDLRVRPRSPPVTTSSSSSNPTRQWPPPPPPVTILVPYPIIVPVPVPLPLPIPIPVPEELLKRATTTTETKLNTTNRTLRKRKRPADENGRRIVSA